MQSKQESIQVFVRVRPPIANEIDIENAVHVNESGQSIHVQSEKHEVTCHYDYIFDEISEQEHVFDRVQCLLDDVLNGYNSCIFAYGQTSSGKTFTMLGPNGGKDLINNKSNWGLIPRAAEYLFNILSQRAQEGRCTYMVKASMLQIYNEQLIDLLSTGSEVSNEAENDLKIREVMLAGSRSSRSMNLQQNNERQCQEVYVAGLSEFRVQTAEDVLQLILLGSSNRTTRSTEFNATSSRSHAVLQLSFEIEDFESHGTKLYHKSKLSLVDLAGSEKMASMGADATVHHLRELTSINKSLSALGNVIAALSVASRTHVPYRDSKLTRLLQDSLGGNTRTVLVACIAPIVTHVAESISTLQFADRAKRVMVRVKANTVVDDKALLARAQTEIARLKLLLKHALSTRGDGMCVGVLEDGETADETARLLLENERLRNEVTALRKELKSCKRDGFGRLRGYEDGVLHHTGTAPRHHSSPNPDGHRQKASKRGLRTSIQAPETRSEKVGSKPAWNDCVALVEPEDPKDRTMGKTGKIRRNVVLGGDGQQPSLRSRRGDKDPPVVRSPSVNGPCARQVNDDVSEDGNGSDEDIQFEGTELEVDLKALRNKLKKTKKNEQLKKLETTIIKAEARNRKSLQAEVEVYNHTKAMRVELEKQLQALLEAQQGLETDEEVDTEEGKSERSGQPQPIFALPTEPSKSSRIRPSSRSPIATDHSRSTSSGNFPPIVTSKTGTETSSPSPLKSAKPSDSSHSGESLADAAVTVTSPSTDRTSATSAPRPKTTAGLLHNRSDVNQSIQIFSFRYNNWETVSITDYEPTRDLHRCVYATGTSQWLNLRQKTVRACV